MRLCRRVDAHGTRGTAIFDREGSVGMTGDQTLIVGLLGVVLVLLVWGRWRYDAVAFAALMAAVVLGVVPKENAFDGFAHTATIIIALVLVVSHGLAASGVVYRLARAVGQIGKSFTSHLAIMGSLGAALSAVMNNVGALALLMPVDVESAKKAKRSPGLSLMPLSFATILGGLVTLIGTPPNIIVSSYRDRAIGAPYEMFDFAPVGIVCAIVGVLFVTLIGWRLIPTKAGQNEDGEGNFKLDDYVAELSIGGDSKFLDQPQADIEKSIRDSDGTLLGIIRDQARLPAHAGWIKVKEDDVLLVEMAAEELERLASENNLEFVAKDRHRELVEGAELEFVECVVLPGSNLEGRTSASVQLVDRFGVWLIGVSRQGKSLRSRVRRTAIQTGDVLLILAPKERINFFIETMDVLPLADRGLELGTRGKAALAAGLFAGAITLASMRIIDLSIALGIVTLLYLLLGIISAKKIYQSVEWPVVVLIGSLIPIGLALETSGVTELAAQSIVASVSDLPGWMVLTILMALTMTLSDVLNNTATALIAAPIAVEVATKLGVSPEPFLMSVAVAASCAFLTPIGHKNNTLVMGPGNYSFGDYWRMGLPLEILIVAVGVPMILLVWPL